MEKNKKVVRKTFLPHQYEREEEFLSKMAKEGWTFIKFQGGFPSKYEFIQSEPIDYIYQLDYVKEEENNDSYHQLFADAGWEEICESDGIYNGKWYYFRRLRNGGKNTAIFTDNDSKVQLYTKLLQDYSLFYFILLLLQYSGFSTAIKDLFHIGIASFSDIMLSILFVIFLLFNIVYITMIIGILIKRRKLVRERAYRL